jgi:hypothetical protein
MGVLDRLDRRLRPRDRGGCCVVGSYPPGRWRRAKTSRPRADILRSVNDALLDWYAEHRRDPPCPADHRPVRHLVPDVMLEQTLVTHVVPGHEGGPVGR